MIKVTLKEYLAKLQRKYGKGVPTLHDIAEAVGTTYVSMSRISNNHIKLLNVTTLSNIIKYLRERGYQAELTDILIYEIN
jgi:hypothetical protein